MRFYPPALLCFALLSACADTPCRPNEFKVGMVCYARKDHDGGAEFDPDRTGEVHEGDGGASDAGIVDTVDGMDAAGRLNGAADAAPRTLEASAPAVDDSSIVVDGAVIDGAAVDTGPTCVPSTELCDGKDNDCDGQIDEGVTEAPIGTDCTNGGKGACAVSGKNACSAGRIICNAPAPDALAAAKDNCSTPGVDEDCNGILNDGCPCGNGVLDLSEQCDDHNLTSGDGCSATCTWEGLGDPHAGVVRCSTAVSISCSGSTSYCQYDPTFEGGEMHDHYDCVVPLSPSSAIWWDLGCDGPEDCAGGLVCGSAHDSPAFFRCDSPTVNNETKLCHHDSDCGANRGCVLYSLFSGIGYCKTL